jgi:hypothetical protein
MSKRIIKSIIFVILLFSFQTIANAQDNKPEGKKDRNIIVVGAAKTLEVGGKAAYIVTKETAKLAWKTTKFTAGEVAAPVAKAIIVKAAPKVTVFLVKKGTPIAAKLVLKYIML